MRKVIITAAVCGSKPTKAQNPAVPYTPAEIAESIFGCHKAGAAIAHVHVREPDGAASHRLELFSEVKERVRRACPIMLNFTTSGLNLKGEDVTDLRLAPVSLKPEIASLDVGSVNFRDKTFVNSPAFVRAAAQHMLAEGVKPEMEVFELGHIEQAKHLIKEGLVVAPPFFQLALGIQWGTPATPENLITMHRNLPEGAPWSVLGVGKAQLPMLAMGVLMGGHVRVGFEDNIYIRKGVLTRNNAEQVEMAVDVIRALQADVASVDEAKSILGIR
mmetsp:Transcript_16120/g.39243  ORF Transcript_16120/g.39243 Transcript_16120/m.39243 type:complete len:274 (+) Transcript_16120:333-1154(+)